MMTRTSRLLKWIGAGTVLLAAAPIAYADGARHTGSPSSGVAAPRTSPRTDSARCGQEPSDFAGTYTVAGRDAVAVEFRADGTMSAFYYGDPATAGRWHADGGEIVWTADGVTYTSVARTATCADPAHASRVTSITATPTNGSAAPTDPAGPLGSDPLTLQRF